METETKIKIRAIILIISILLLVIMFIAAIKQSNEQIEEYNNGICSCGGEYHLVAINNTGVCYECNKCGHTVRLLKLMK